MEVSRHTGNRVKLGIAPGLASVLVLSSVGATGPSSSPVGAARSESTAPTARHYQPGSPQHIQGDEVPAGLTREDWAQIRRGIAASSYEAVAAARPGERGPVVEARNARQRYGATFRRGSVELAAHSSVPDPWRLGLAVTGYGYEGDLRPLPGAVPEARADQVEYRRGPVTERYVNRPLGLEQTFELAQPATRHERPLVLAMAVAGDLSVRGEGADASFTDESGQVRLHYAGLKSWDADGRPVESRLEVGEKQIRIVVDAQDARFPVTVDPTFFIEAQFLPHGDLSELAGTGFGCAVAVEGDTVAVGAFAQPGAQGPSVGAAYIFVRVGGVFWAQQQKLLPSIPAAGDQYGWSIALNGDTVVVGVPFDDMNGLNDVGSAYVYTRSGTLWTEQQYLVASDGAEGDQFGWRVSVWGDTLAVGAPFDDVVTPSDQGSAYVFVRSGSTWTEQQRVSPADGAAGDNFGNGVAVYGDTLVAGAPGDDTTAGAGAGSAYVFVRSGITWSQQQKLEASDAAPGDSFGHAVALEGDTAAVGAPDETNSEGAVYVYVRAGTTWTEQQKLTGSDSAPNDNFGSSVSLSGDTLLSGAPFNGTITGAGYVYVRAGTTWTEQQKLVTGSGAIEFAGFAVSVSGNTAMLGAHASGVGVGSTYAYVRNGTTWSFTQRLLPPYNTADDRFATSVSVSGSTVIIGAPNDDTPVGGTDSGTAFVFARPTTFWVEQGPLRASDAGSDDFFGESVAISGNTAVVGAPGDDTPAGADAGSAYVFFRTGSTWTEQQKLTASDAAAGDRFGSSVAIDGDTVVVGAPDDNVAGQTAQGSVYAFLRSGVTWTEQQKITAADGAAQDAFGTSVGVSIDTAVIGAPGDDTATGVDAGSAYVFLRTGTTWALQQKLGIFGAAGDALGTAVSIDGDTALVGAPGADTSNGPDTGAAYSYDRLPGGGGTWNVPYELSASDGVAGNALGQAVSISGNEAFVGAPAADPAGAGTDAGAVYVYFRPAINSFWVEQPKLLAPGGSAGDAFGSSVSVDGVLGAVGAPLDDLNGGVDSGTVDVYRLYVQADVSVTKTDNQTTAAPGETLTYTIVVSNAGPEAAVGATVTDTLPAVLLSPAWTCTASAGSSCSASGTGNISDTVTLLVGGTATYHLTATLSQTATGTVSNTASITLAVGGNDPVPGDNTATDTDTIAAESDLTIAKSDAPDPALPAGPLVYTLTVTNAGPSNATGVVVTDQLPAGVTFVSSTPGAPTCTFGGSTLTCTLGALASAATSTITINTTVSATAGIVVNTASVTAAEPDPVTGNNTATASTAVGARADAELTHGLDEVFDLAALPGPVADVDVYRMSQKPYSSYEVLIDEASGDIGGPSGPILERLGGDGTTVVQNSVAVGAGFSRSLRWFNSTAAEVEDEVIRVRSAGCSTDCGADDIYRLRVYETSYAIPRFNNSGSQITVLVLQNPTNYTITGQAYFRATSGALVGTHAFSLNPKAALVVNTATIPGVAGTSGGILVSHDGRYGDLAGKAVALEPATGFSFDSALDVRVR